MPTDAQRAEKRCLRETGLWRIPYAEEGPALAQPLHRGKQSAPPSHELKASFPGASGCPSQDRASPPHHTLPLVMPGCQHWGSGNEPSQPHSHSCHRAGPQRTLRSTAQLSSSLSGPCWLLHGSLPVANLKQLTVHGRLKSCSAVIALEGVCWFALLSLLLSLTPHPHQNWGQDQINPKETGNREPTSLLTRPRQGLVRPQSWGTLTRRSRGLALYFLVEFCCAPLTPPSGLTRPAPAPQLKAEPLPPHWPQGGREAATLQELCHLHTARDQCRWPEIQARARTSSQWTSL